jgi:tartrate/fumarate subfamily iron-sulfur-dependent hydro-lyase alpha chain
VTTRREADRLDSRAVAAWERGHRFGADRGDHMPLSDEAYAAVEEAAKQTYLRALKLVPPDVKAALRHAFASETSETGRQTLDIILENMKVAEADDMLVCQDTGTVVYWIEVGDQCELVVARLAAAVGRGTERATTEHPLRPNAVHPVTRANTGTNTGRHLPVLHWGVTEGEDVRLSCLPKGSGSENMSFLRMFVPADGVSAVKRFVLECLVEAGPKPCPPTIVGVGLGGTSDLCAALAKKALLRPLSQRNDDPTIAALEEELEAAANELGIGPMGLGGRNTVLGVNIEWAHTHITQNPVAVNLQCWAARRASALISPNAEVSYGF